MTLADTILQYDAAYPGTAPASVEVPANVWAKWLKTAKREAKYYARIKAMSKEIRDRQKAERKRFKENY